MGTLRDVLTVGGKQITLFHQPDLGSDNKDKLEELDRVIRERKLNIPIFEMPKGTDRFDPPVFVLVCADGDMEDFDDILDHLKRRAIPVKVPIPPRRFEFRVTVGPIPMEVAGCHLVAPAQDLLAEVYL